ncbi:MAG: YggS family pyridoxal phosphate-dependent enzyme [Nitrospinaceae bacterium]|nr:YggS family pyridoxal phosphate-dependent enzyme [Nitrospinaceae bacterium]MBT3433412.1 YggS family pyridoxal phosphate-dependent enzyme [Nitrospinaceae bacterium]MBT4429367.1 YggS family pyridoxal phosphate-dependent enzyme [Nitrospinaceae bacterium]MBT5948502.1 YggS family pyridoxal phosphate-dependent enzyme [Nitrospinaceae bacterium]MBT6393710.1 YggS family pyridoxal phosphate-dependent enzyme [Nitrospinaceae bacterium]
MGFSQARYEEVLARVAAAAKKSGRQPGDVELVSVSKTQPPEVVAEAIEGGVRILGENRVQEARDKRAALDPELAARARWHLIGSLQRNKARQVPGLFDVVESVDSAALASALSERVAGSGQEPLEVFIQVNTGDEPQKGGVLPAELSPLLEEISGLASIRVVGLMCIPPLGREPEESRPHFQMLREFRDRAAESGFTSLARLSMGMSSDYEVAIEEGATSVRVGRAIFGARD